MRYRFIANNRKSLSISVTLVFLLIVSIGIGYSYIYSTLYIGGSTAISKSSWDVHLENMRTINGTVDNNENISLNPNTGITFDVTLESISDKYVILVDVVNKGTIDAMVLSHSLLGLSATQVNYIDFKVEYNTGLAYNNKDIRINDKLEAGQSDTLKITIGYKDGVTLNQTGNTTEELNLSFEINYGQKSKRARDRGSELLQLLLKNNEVNSDSDVDYTQPASSGNGEGFMVKAGTQSDDNPIYFFRGNVSYNYVAIGRDCYRILRTTETGGIKLIYDSEYNGSYCYGMPASYISNYTAGFNSNYNDNAYAGFMYGQTSASTYTETHANIHPSTALTKLNTQRQSCQNDITPIDNIIFYKDILEDYPYCNNRENLTSANNGSSSSSDTEITGGYAMNLTCNQTDDRFTVSSGLGNGKLTYPIGLLTAQEAVYAGVFYTTNSSDSSNSFLRTTNDYWTMTPSGYGTTGMRMFYVTSNGTLMREEANTTELIRPVITLNRDVRIKSGNGYEYSPYLVDYTPQGTLEICP